MKRLLALVHDFSIDAPRASTDKDHIEEDEAIENGRIAAVERGKEGFRQMLREIGDRHVTREDESDRPRKEPERQKDAPRDLDHTLDVVESVARRSGRREAEIFLQAMLEEAKRRDDPHDAEDLRRPLFPAFE